MHSNTSARLKRIHEIIHVHIIDLNVSIYNYESNQLYRAFQYLEAEPDSITQSAPTNTIVACSVPIEQMWC